MDREEGVAELRALVVKLRDELSGFAGVGRLDRSKCETLESFSEQGKKICNDLKLDELFCCKIVLSTNLLGYRGKEKAGGAILQIIARIPPSGVEDYVMPTMRRFCVPIESDGRDEVISRSEEAMTVLDNLLGWLDEMKPEWVREERWPDCPVGEMEPEFVREKACVEGSIGGNKTSDMIRTLRAKLSALKAPVTTEDGWVELSREFDTIRRRGLREWANEYLKVELGGGLYEQDFPQHAVKYTWRDPDEKEAKTVERGFVVLSELMNYWERNHVMETIDRFVGYLGRLEKFALFHEGEENPKEAAEVKAGNSVGGAEMVSSQTDELDHGSNVSRLPKSLRYAFLAFRFAEETKGVELTYGDAWAFLNEYGFDECIELQEYELPTQETFSNYVSKSLNKLGSPRNARRAGRESGSLVKRDKI